MLNATGPDTVRLLPPLTVSEDEIDEAVRRIGGPGGLTGVLLFAYGSNLAAEEVAPGARFLGPAVLPDYRLALTRRSIRWGGGVVDVVPAPGERVWGAAYDGPGGGLGRSGPQGGRRVRLPAPDGARSSWHGETLEAA